jgi:hypothetical protein
MRLVLRPITATAALLRLRLSIAVSLRSTSKNRLEARVYGGTFISTGGVKTGSGTFQSHGDYTARSLAVGRDVSEKLFAQSHTDEK